MNRTSSIAWAWGLLAIVAAAVDGRAQQTPSGGRSAVGLVRVRSLHEMARYKGIHKEIGLTDFTKLDALKAELRQAAADAERPAGIDREVLRGLKGPERLAKMTEIMTKSQAAMKKVNEQIDPKLKEALTPQQYARVKEVFIQFAGADALAHQEIAQDLGLSEEQQKKIAAVQAEWDKENSDSLLTGAVADPAGTLKKMQEMHEKSLTKATAVLTAAQKKKLDELKGKPFDFSQLGSGR